MINTWETLCRSYLIIRMNQSYVAFVISSLKQQLAWSTTPTCLTALPTLSTSMTQPGQRRRTWSGPLPICLTELKPRSARSSRSHFSSIIQWLSVVSWDDSVHHSPLLCIRYLSWWRWTATGALCALPSTRAAHWQVWRANCYLSSLQSQSTWDPGRMWPQKAPQVTRRWIGRWARKGKKMLLLCVAQSNGFPFIAVFNRRSQTVTACRVVRVPQRNIDRKEDPGEVVAVRWHILCIYIEPQHVVRLYFTVTLLFSLLVSFLFITTDTSNTQGSVSQKESHMSVKSTSSVELGSLYRQIEVSVPVTKQF